MPWGRTLRCRWSRNSCRRRSRKTCFADGGPAALPVSRQRHGPSGAGPILVCGRRSVRFRAVSGRRQRRLGGAGASGWAASPPPASPGCRRFRAAPPGCSATIWDAAWNVVPPPGPTSSACPPWPSGSTTWSWRSTTLAGRAWIISQGFPEIEPSRRRRRAAERLAQVRDWIAEPRATLGRQLHCHPGGGSATAAPGIMPLVAPISRSPACRA